MKKVNILFLNNKALEELGAYNMPDVIKDVENAYKLTELGDVNIPGKLVMRWGKTPQDENVYGRINAMPGFIGGDYNMAGIKWIGSGPQNYKKGLPRASVTLILTFLSRMQRSSRSAEPGHRGGPSSKRQRSSVRRWKNAMSMISDRRMQRAMSKK